MANIICPACGSSNIRFDVRQGGRESKSNYYRTGVKNSWVLPAGQKRYRSRQKYISLCQCQDCGNLWQKENQAAVVFLKFIGYFMYVAVYVAIIQCLLNLEGYGTGTYIGYILACVAMTAGIGWWVWRKVKKRR